VINDERISLRVRRALNVESGLNDGIVTPIVVFTIAVAASQLGVAGSHDEAGFGPLLELAVGILVGVAVGLGSAKLIGLASRRRWVAPGGRRLATLAAALGSFTLAVALSGNGFIAAFVAGIAFGAAFPRVVADIDQVGELPELVGEVLALSVWFLFGATLVPVTFEFFSLSTALYAVLSLTVIRLVPVWIGMARAGLDGATVLFMGWFGPRGLASVVFALLAVEGLGESQLVGEAVSVVTFTVLLSVVVHGVSAGPLGRRYAFGHSDAAGEDVGLQPRARRQGHQ
jgi:NhaP-type Na+/H+ or K+/H+ antiporter